MEYTGTEFARLVDAIEDDGGVHLDDLCEPIHHRIKTSPKGRFKVYKGTGCDDATMFKIGYKSAIFGPNVKDDQLVEVGTTPDGSTAMMAVPVDEGVHLLRVCANDDDLGKWPRFADALETDWEEA